MSCMSFKLVYLGSRQTRSQVVAVCCASIEASSLIQTAVRWCRKLALASNVRHRVSCLFICFPATCLSSPQCCAQVRASHTCHMRCTSTVPYVCVSKTLWCFMRCFLSWLPLLGARQPRTETEVTRLRQASQQARLFLLSSLSLLHVQHLLSEGKQAVA